MEVECIFDKKNVETKEIIQDIFLTHRLMCCLHFIDESEVENDMCKYFSDIFIKDDYCDNVVEDIITLRVQTLSRYIESLYIKSVLEGSTLTIINTVFNHLISHNTTDELKNLTKKFLKEILTAIFKDGNNSLLSLVYRSLRLSIDNTIRYKPRYVDASCFRIFLRDTLVLFDIGLVNNYNYNEDKYSMITDGSYFRDWLNLLQQMEYRKEGILECVEEI